MKRAGLIVTICGASIAGLGAIAFVGMRLVEPILADTLTREIEARSGLKVEIGSAHIGLGSSLQIVVNDVRFSDPKRPLPDPLLKSEHVTLSVAAAKLIGGDLEISQVNLIRPILHLVAQGAAATAPHNSKDMKTQIEAFKISDGTFILDNLRQDVSARLEHVNLEATHAASGGLSLMMDATSGGQSLHLDANAASLGDLAAGMPTSLKAEIRAAGLSDRPVQVTSKIRLADGTLRFDDVAANALGGRISGSAALNWDAIQPVVAARLAADRLILTGFDFDRSGAMDLKQLRLFDAAVDLSADSLRFASMSATNLRSKVTLTDGMLRLNLQNADAYRGKARGEVVIDASRQGPKQSVSFELARADVQPLLVDAVDSDELTGQLQFKLDLKAAGTSPHDMVAKASGTASLAFQNGAFTGLELPPLLRAVVPYLPSAWREQSRRITVDSLTATFRVANGRAETADLHLTSPVADVSGKGQIDLANHQLDLRFDPKIIADGRGANKSSPLDLGASILVRGPWDDPRVSADLSALMQDPQGTLGKLQTLGQGLMAPDAKNGKSTPDAPDLSKMPVDSIMKGLGDLLGGLGEGRQIGLDQRSQNRAGSSRNQTSERRF